MLFASLTDVGAVLRRLQDARKPEGSEFASLADVSEAIELATQFDYILGHATDDGESMEDHAERLWILHQYGAHTLSILEVCAAAEYYLKDVFLWVLHQRPELLAGAPADVKPSAKSLATAQSLENVRSEFARTIVSAVAKGERWREKARHVTKYLGIAFDAIHPEGTSFLEELFRARNVIMHMQAHQDLDLVFGAYQLRLSRSADRPIQIANSRGLSNVIRVGSQAIADLDLAIATKHLRPKRDPAA